MLQRSGIVRVPVYGQCSAVLFAGAALGKSCEKWGGKIVSVQGVVQGKKAGESTWTPVELNATYCPGDTIRVLKKVGSLLY